MHEYYTIWQFGFYHGGSAEISMNSMSRKGQQLNLDQEMSLVKGLSGPDFGASWMNMQVALGVSLWYCLVWFILLAFFTLIVTANCMCQFVPPSQQLR